LIWLGSAPEFGPEPLQVLVVLDGAGARTLPQRSAVGALMNRARGSLGHQSREQVLADLERSRQDWER
jgi:hypothetical protein